MKDYFDKEIKTDKKVISAISKDDFLIYLKKNNIRNIDNVPYNEIVRNACRYGVMYMLMALGKKNRALLNEISIAEGYVGMNWHCWLVTYSYYIDLTLCQFDSKFPDLFVIKRSDAKKQQILTHKKLYTVREWFEWEESH